MDRYFDLDSYSDQKYSYKVCARFKTPVRTHPDNLVIKNIAEPYYAEDTGSLSYGASLFVPKYEA